MGHLEDQCASLQARIAATEVQLADLKQELARAQEAVANAQTQKGDHTPAQESQGRSSWPLGPEEYKRYGRQMIVSQVGLPGESRCAKRKIGYVAAGWGEIE